MNLMLRAEHSSFEAQVILQVPNSTGYAENETASKLYKTTGKSSTNSSTMTAVETAWILCTSIRF